MATPIRNNLPPGSQQWVRDIERRMADLERQNQLLQVTANRNATQIGSIQAALSAVPIIAGASDELVGSGSLVLNTAIDIPSGVNDFTALAVGTVSPRQETGGGGGTLVDGEGVLTTNYDYRNIVAPLVTSDPLQELSSSAIWSVNEFGSSVPVTEITATFTASFSGGSPGQGGGFATLVLMVFPRTRSN